MARKERLIHLLLRERLGGQTPPDLSDQIMQQIDGAAPPQSTTGEPPVVRRVEAPIHSLPRERVFSPWIAVAASIAVVATIALAIAAYTVSNQENDQPAVAGPDNTFRLQPEQNTPGVYEDGGKPDREPEPRRESNPEPRIPDQVEDPETPGKEPNEAPDVKPEPQPERDPVVEEPAPEPDPEHVPEPQPEKDPVVEEPEPTEPRPDVPPTVVPERKPMKLGSILYAPENARLEWRIDDDGRWEDWENQREVTAGMQLKARRPVAVQMADGARFYFDGEVLVDGDEDSLEVGIESDSVYFDVYGSRREFTARRGEVSLTFVDAEVVVERSGKRLSVSCLGGEVTVGDLTLNSGWTASLSDDGFDREKFVGAKLRNNPLVSSMDRAFVLVRNELNDPDGVYVGRWSDGVVTGAGHEGSGKEGEKKDLAFGIEFEVPVEVKERSYLRMRIRVHNSEGYSIGFGSTEESGWRYFQSHHKDVPNDEWIVVKLPLEALKDDGEDKFIWPGVALCKFQIVLWDKEASQVELDWFEIGIEPEWEED